MELLRQAHHFDKDITLSINSLSSPVTDRIWLIFSNKEIWIVLYLAVIVLLFVRLGWKKALLSIIACVLCIVACDQGCNVVKAYFERLRPCQDLDMIERGLRMLEGQGSLYGFFSAHAANAMGFAMCTSGCFSRLDKSRSYKAYTIGITLWGILVGMSRVFVGKHFFGDVMVGLAFGTLIGILMAMLAGRTAKLELFNE